jgi:hypothetical protein
LQVHKRTKKAKQPRKLRDLFDSNVLWFSLLLFFFAYEPGDSAIFEFQMIKRYEVGPMLLAVAQILGFVMIMLSSFTFRRCCGSSRVIVVVTTTTLCCVLLIVLRNLFLTNRIVVNSKVFFIGNVLWGSFFSHLSFLPLAVISTALCKKGAEATMYAYFMSITNFASIISREISGFLADKIGIRKQLVIESIKLDLFYIICLVLDVIGMVVVFFLLIKVQVPEQVTEIEMIAFDPEELKALEAVENTIDDELQDVPLD